MISAAQLIGVFMMCFVFILGAYMLGNADGYKEGFRNGRLKGFIDCEALYEELMKNEKEIKERQAMKDD